MRQLSRKKGVPKPGQRIRDNPNPTFRSPIRTPDYKAITYMKRT